MTKKYFKFLDGNLASYHNPKFFYPSPIMKDGKWIPGEWVKENDFTNDSQACGKGLHLMKILIPKYGRYTGNCFEAEGKDLLGEDSDKARFKSIRLIKPVNPKEIFKNSADLSSADLSSANLRLADLSSADLSSADLSSANLSSANLSSADLSSADLSSAENIDQTRNIDKAYWNKFTQIDDEFKHLLNKNKFIQ